MDQKLSTTAEMDFEVRKTRVEDAIALRPTDQTPFHLAWRFWPAFQAGITFEKAMYDPASMRAAAAKLIPELKPDHFQNPLPNIAIGNPLETMDFQALNWPGHGVDKNVSYQYIDQEFMFADEYDDYLFDPTGYFLHTYLPRVAGVFEPFKQLPDIPSLYYLRILMGSRGFTQPGVQEAFDKIATATEQVDDMLAEAIGLAEDMAGQGFPTLQAGTASAPFDLFTDYMRGSKGAMLDMFRQPDNLLAAIDKASRIMVRSVIKSAAGRPGKLIFMPLHWGLDGFMSPEKFETFYWPQLRQVILELIEADLVPYVFWEGECGSRLETIADIPAGKAIYKFERTDLFRAKEILGDVVCIQGNVPGSMLNTSTPDEVDDYCRRLIQEVGKGGGFILDGAVGVPDEAKYENVLAMAQPPAKYRE